MAVVHTFSLVPVHNDPVFVMSSSSEYLLCARHHNIFFSDIIISYLELILRLRFLKHRVVLIDLL